MLSFLSKLSLYWYCQIIGWGAATLYWAYYTLDDCVPWWMSVGGLLTSFSFCIFSTHLYKKLAYQNDCHLLALKPLVPIMLMATFIQVSGYTIFNYVICSIKFGDLVDSTTILGMLTGGLRYHVIWLLIFHLYHYAKRESKIELQNLAYQKLATEAQLTKLNTELNPHFLFNSLNSIKALILEDPNAARRSVVLLSDMLRYSLQLRDKDGITLAEELIQVEDLLQLEKVRFGDRLNYDLQIDPNSRQAIILPLSLHTMVENAIKHGISNQIKGGQVAIKTSVQQQQLLLEVINDGQLKTNNARKGIGLDNLKERLSIRFANQAQFQIQNLNPYKVRASLKTPLHYA